MNIKVPKEIIVMSLSQNGEAWQFVCLKKEDLSKPVNTYKLNWLGHRLIISEKANNILKYITPEKSKITITKNKDV